MRNRKYMVVPFGKMNESQCKEAINSLEHWIRNLIDRELTKSYGKEYLDHHVNEKRLIKKSLVEKLKERYSANQERYSRIVDAMLLEEEVQIICHPDLYKKHFQKPLGYSYPNNETARYFLNQIIPIRNKLYHSNHISKRDHEKIICYSHDAIESIKEFYKGQNMKKEYNVPSIISFSDSLGNKIHSNQISRIVRRKAVVTDHDFKNNNVLHQGETLDIQVEIDESFSEEEYKVQWIYLDSQSAIDYKTVEGKRVSIKIEERHIREQFHITLSVISNKAWHRFGVYDDRFALNYKVLPII